MRNNEAWLNLTMEEPTEPDLPICDPHHHLWDGSADRGRYLLDEFLADAGGGHHIVKTVFVECGAKYRKAGPQEMRPVGETEFVKAITGQIAAGQYGAVAVASAIVGFADLAIGPNVDRVLEAHIEAGKDRLRGIRQSCTWDSDPAVMTMSRGQGMMLDVKFRKGFACLGKLGLSFDAWQYYTQLMELVDLARTFPETTIVVNHIGGPLGIGRYTGKSKEVFQQWKQSILELASCPNVVMKLGGLGMPRCGFGWHEREKPPGSAELAEAIKPYVQACIEIFGADRCMFESNFPVDKVSYSYTVLWNAFKRVSKDCSPKERKALFHDTAVRVYRLSDTDKAS